MGKATGFLDYDRKENAGKWKQIIRKTNDRL